MYFYDAATILRQVNSKIVKVADFFFLLAVDHDFALLCVGLHAKSLCILNQYVGKRVTFISAASNEIDVLYLLMK